MMTGRPTSYMIINYIPGPRSLRSPPPHLWYFGRHHVRLRQRFEARHDLTNFFLHIKINVFNYPFFKIELISCSCRNYNTKSNSIESRVTICQFILAKFIYLLLKNKPQQIKEFIRKLTFCKVFLLVLNIFTIQLNILRNHALIKFP